MCTGMDSRGKKFKSSEPLSLRYTTLLSFFPPSRPAKWSTPLNILQQTFIYRLYLFPRVRYVPTLSLYFMCTYSEGV